MRDRDIDDLSLNEAAVPTALLRRKALVTPGRLSLCAALCWSSSASLAQFPEPRSACGSDPELLDTAGSPRAGCHQR